jgi:hypothetical protein
MIKAMRFLAFSKMNSYTPRYQGLRYRTGRLHRRLCKALVKGHQQAIASVVSFKIQTLF